MPALDVLDSTWIAARPVTVSAVVSDPANWRRWWPGLHLVIDEWRAEKGVRWNVTSVGSGATADLAGTAEIWLEPMGEGVVAHFFLRLDPAPGCPLSRRLRERITREYRLHTKRAFWALADRLDPGRVDRHLCSSPASAT